MGDAAKKIDVETKTPGPDSSAQTTASAFKVVPPGPLTEGPTVLEKLTEAATQTPPTFKKFMTKHIEIAEELAKDPLNLREVRHAVRDQIFMNPRLILEERMWRMKKYGELWMYAWAKMWGFSPAPVINPKHGDNRWKHADWNDRVWFDCTKQAYLIWSQSIHRIFHTPTTDNKNLAKRVQFYTKLFTDAFSPTNFLLTNPEVIAKTYATKGENLIDGYLNFLDDIERGNGSLAMTSVDTKQFQVGKNLAVTPGKVVYQNELMQLLQYSPTTETVAKSPILVTPAWINKYYILDLQQKNSLIKFMVDQGNTVFAISWVNPDKKLSHKRFEDYMLEGPVEAVKQIKLATGAERVNLVGYCLGGTLTATTAAYLAAKADDSVNSMTLLTTLTDFSHPGDLGVFIDEKQMQSLEKKMVTKGCLEADEMSAAFNLLKSNELLFQQAVNNYLLAKPPLAFDLLVWNADATRMPSAMHSFYLRKMYVENALCKPGAITLDHTPIDLTAITCPVYQISAKEDHIAPWTSTYAGTQLFSGPRRFVLSESGHIAGVVNPPANKKYNHWVNEQLVADPEQWFAKATYTPGSWWNDWANWSVKLHGNEQVTARTPGEGPLKAIEDAPGSYVKARAVV